MANLEWIQFFTVSDLFVACVARWLMYLQIPCKRPVIYGVRPQFLYLPFQRPSIPMHRNKKFFFLIVFLYPPKLTLSSKCSYRVLVCWQNLYQLKYNRAKDRSIFKLYKLGTLSPLKPRHHRNSFKFNESHLQSP